MIVTQNPVTQNSQGEYLGSNTYLRLQIGCDEKEGMAEALISWGGSYVESPRGKSDRVEISWA